MNSKQQLKALFRGKALERPLFIPLIGTYLAKVNQKSMQDIFSDPGLLYQGMRDAQQLLQSDVVITPLDETLEAEAFGYQVDWDESEKKMVIKSGDVPESSPDPETWITMGRIPIFIEAIKRFAQVEGKQIPLFAVVTGPVTLAHLVYGENGEAKINEINQYLIQLIKSYAEVGVDGIIINDGMATQSSWTADYKPLINVIRYYNRIAMIRWTDSPPLTEQTMRLNMHGLIAPAHEKPINKRLVWGIALENKELSQPEIESELTREHDLSMYKQYFFTTTQPLNHEDDDLMALQNNIKKIVDV